MHENFIGINIRPLEIFSERTNCLLPSFLHRKGSIDNLDRKYTHIRNPINKCDAFLKQYVSIMQNQMIVFNFVASSSFIKSNKPGSKEFRIRVIILKSWGREIRILHEISSRICWVLCYLLTKNKQEHNIRCSSMNCALPQSYSLSPGKKEHLEVALIRWHHRVGHSDGLDGETILLPLYAVRSWPSINQEQPSLAPTHDGIPVSDSLPDRTVRN